MAPLSIAEAPETSRAESVPRLHCAGVSHKTCSVEVRERLAAKGAGAALAALSAEGFPEAVVLSTCNRFEVYACGRGPADPLLSFLRRFSGGGPESFYSFSGSEAAGHLFLVSAGLDSLVVGETEILGQVKLAYEAALAAGATGKLTNVLFQRALFAGKAVRRRTRISAGRLSVSSVAVELARRLFGDLGSSRVLILGAGEMARKTAKAFLGEEVSALTILNRTWEKAAELSRELGRPAEPARWEDLPLRLAEADVVLASTGAPTVVLDRSTVARALEGRPGRPLFLIDIAMPRDIAEDAGALAGAHLYSLQDFESITAENRELRLRETQAAREIVELETRLFARWLDSLERGREFSLKHSLPRHPQAAA